MVVSQGRPTGHQRFQGSLAQSSPPRWAPRAFRTSPLTLPCAGFLSTVISGNLHGGLDAPDQMSRANFVRALMQPAGRDWDPLPPGVRFSYLTCLIGLKRALIAMGVPAPSRFKALTGGMEQPGEITAAGQIQACGSAGGKAKGKKKVGLGANNLPPGGGGGRGARGGARGGRGGRGGKKQQA